MGKAIDKTYLEKQFQNYEEKRIKTGKGLPDDALDDDTFAKKISGAGGLIDAIKESRGLA